MRIWVAVVAAVLTVGAHAATFNVNDTADANDANPGDGVCATAGATCTLRAAVTESNALAGRDTVHVPAGTYTSASSYVFTDFADLIGAGRDLVTIQPRLQSGSNTVATEIHLEVVGITTPQILVYDDLTLRDSTTPGLYTQGYFEIAVRGLNHVRVHGSRLGTVHIDHYATASISDSVIENGGITLSEATVFVERSSIVNSLTRSQHHTTGSRSDAVFINCTFTGASSGFSMAQQNDMIDINYCTFADGARVSSSGRFVVTNSIFRNGGAVANCASGIRTGYNISDDATCGGQPTDRVNTNPMLGPLTVENGKPVYPLLPGSPALDSAGALVRVDERGVGRPQGGGPDVGAYESCSACAPPRRFARGDFNLDGRSDIFWYFTGNQKHAFWLMNGTTVLSGQYVENHPSSETAKLVDFDGDGDTDIWTAKHPRFMENTVVRTRDQIGDTSILPSLQPGVAHAVADFNGDGREDIMVRTGDTGAVLIYLMAGFYGMARYAAVPAPEWQFVAANDFDGDGRGDLTWRNSQTSEVVLWKMKDWFVTGTVSLASPNSDWQFLAAGDFTGDGRADLLWRHSQTAQIAQWELDQNGALVSALIIAQTPQPWNVRAVGKLNDDSTDDLVWRQDGAGGNGDNAAWLMAPGGGILTSQYLVDVPDLGWLMLGPR